MNFILSLLDPLQKFPLTPHRSKTPLVLQIPVMHHPSIHYKDPGTRATYSRKCVHREPHAMRAALQDQRRWPLLHLGWREEERDCRGPVGSGGSVHRRSRTHIKHTRRTRAMFPQDHNGRPTSAGCLRPCLRTFLCRRTRTRSNLECQR